MNRYHEEDSIYHSADEDQARSCPHGDEEEDDSSDDDSIIGSGEANVYLGNIAAACEAVNADCKHPFRSERERREERRIANRRSAKMSRDRKRMERDQLQDQATMLAQHNLALTRENEDLRKQVRQLTQQQSRSVTPATYTDATQLGFSPHQHQHHHQHQSMAEGMRQHLSTNFLGGFMLPPDIMTQKDNLMFQLMMQEKQKRHNSSNFGPHGIENYPSFAQQESNFGSLPNSVGQSQMEIYNKQNTESTTTMTLFGNNGLDSTGMDAFPQTGEMRQRRGSDNS